ncbi:hypothetical protein BKA70DRAFT_1466451 [Coprinopsis sp. MPI-PUGE-AT-0042]|nr:hypothetical protein BKA70DRAFT_1466451 [Coprinopsis sp. MPI-PUGE-AT-0042]
MYNGRSTSVEDNAECVGGILRSPKVLLSYPAFDMAQQARSEESSGNEAVLPNHVLRPYRSHSALPTRTSQSRVPQPNTLTCERYSSRVRQESHDDACTTTVHAQIAHEFCRGPITSTPLGEQASMRREQQHLRKLRVAEATPTLPDTKRALPLLSSSSWDSRREDHIDGLWVALGIRTQDSRFDVAPPAWGAMISAVDHFASLSCLSRRSAVSSPGTPNWFWDIVSISTFKAPRLGARTCIPFAERDRGINTGDPALQPSYNLLRRNPTS